MGKIGFNCQLLLSEIGLATDSSHSTWFHKRKSVRFFRSKSSRFYMKKILFSMFYSILVGEEPDSVLLKKEGKQNQVKMIRITLLLAPKILPFPKELELHFFSISIQKFLSYVFPRPFLRPRKMKWTNSFS